MVDALTSRTGELAVELEHLSSDVQLNTTSHVPSVVADPTSNFEATQQISRKFLKFNDILASSYANSYISTTHSTRGQTPR